ncbi:MAG: helix-turn-helix domain-containing protein [Lachnospiraceae bacterium]|nr:helix-turn-helix domain-containing protein [Lachnospiraceae bacterium]
MAIFKNKTQNNFTMISNNIFRDKDLSMKDRGVLCTLFSLPDGWNFSISGLCTIVSDGYDSLTSSVRRLEELGYLERTKTRDSNGKFVSVIEVFIERKTIPDLPSRKNRHGKSITDSPSRCNRYGEAVTENPAQYNNDNTQNDINTENPKSINQSASPKNMIDRLTDVASYKKTIADNIKLDWLLTVAKEHGESETVMVNEIYDVICDMVCYQRDSVRIKDTSYPWDVVKSQFLKLRHEHITDILNRLVDSDLKIKNMSNYLISTLYTASLVGTLENESNMHDDYLKHLRGKPY